MKLVIVNGEQISSEDLARETLAVKELLLQQMPEEDPIDRAIRAKEWAEENLVESMLLKQAAWQDPTPIPAAALEQEMVSVPGSARDAVEGRLRIERLLHQVTANIEPPSRKDARSLYLQNRDHFYGPETVRASHIVKNIDGKQDEAAARTGIEAALAELARKRPFAEVASSFSDCPGNGDLGYFARGRMVPEFDDVVFALKPGQRSPIFRTVFGFHIALLVDRRPQGVRPFDEVFEEIQQKLIAEARQSAVHAFLDHLRSRAEIRRENPVTVA